MTTRKLFKEDVYLKESEATCLSVVLGENKAYITLDQTIFFPEGGGQSSDIGTIDSMSVVDVKEEDGKIVHAVALNEAKHLCPGDKVHLKLDWNHRFDNMQRHCGEHILTGIFYRDYRVINRGFHMGDDYMTIDLAIEEEAKEFGTATIDWEMCKAAEYETNKVIWQDMPMITRHFDTFEEASKEPMRKKLTVKEDITLVGIGKPEYDWGCVACCGTHPHTTGQVGMVKIFKVEPNKGMFRIYFEAGERAFRKYQNELDVLTAISHRVSAGTDDLISKFEAQEEKTREKHAQLTALKKLVVRQEAEKILNDSSEIRASREISASRGISASREIGADQSNIALHRDVYYHDVLTIDDLMQVAKEVCPKLSQRRIVFLVHSPSNTVLLLSNGSVDCGKLVKENANIYNGKGGGSKELARAIFSRKDYVDTFIDLIKKHLQ